MTKPFGQTKPKTSGPKKRTAPVVEGMNPGYLLFIQMCGVFWRDPANKDLKLGLLMVLDNYQFLGICGVMWRFLGPAARTRWTLEASRPTLRKTELQTEIKQLAKLTLGELEGGPAFPLTP